MLILDEMPFRACCGPAVWARWLSVSPAKSRRMAWHFFSRFLGLSLLEWVQLPRARVYLQSKWGWRLLSACSTVQNHCTITDVFYLCLHLRKWSENAVLSK